MQCVEYVVERGSSEVEDEMAMGPGLHRQGRSGRFSSQSRAMLETLQLVYIGRPFSKFIMNWHFELPAKRSRQATGVLCRCSRSSAYLWNVQLLDAVLRTLHLEKGQLFCISSTTLTECCCTEVALYDKESMGKPRPKPTLAPAHLVLSLLPEYTAAPASPSNDLMPPCRELLRDAPFGGGVGDLERGLGIDFMSAAGSVEVKAGDIFSFEAEGIRRFFSCFYRCRVERRDDIRYSFGVGLD